MHDSDAEILDRIAQGEVNAYATLVERYKDKAYSLAAGMLGDETEAEEAVQDAFVRAFRALPGFNREAAFSTWLYRIVYNQCLTRSVRRKIHRERTVELPEDDLLFSGAPLPDGDLEEKEFRHIVHREIERLPEQYRSMLVLFFLRDQSYNDIVEITNLPLGTVKTRLHRARALLRTNVLKHYNTTTSVGVVKEGTGR